MTTPLVSLEDKLTSLKATRDFVNTQIAEIYKEIKRTEIQPRNVNKTQFSIVKNFNCSIGPNVSFTDLFNIFITESVKHFEKADIYDLLVTSGAFESKGQARKNWQGIKEIPTGYSEIGPIGKSKLFLFIWNPSIEE